MKKNFILLFLLFFSFKQGIAQSIGISESAITPNTMSILELNSNTKGLLLPRVTTAQMNAITGTSAQGLIVYNTTENMFYYNNTTSTTANWVPLLSNSPSTTGMFGGWDILGNNSTNSATNALGTFDGTDMLFKTNNAERMRITSGGLIGLGTAAPGYSLTLSGTNSVFGIENNTSFMAKNSSGTYETYFTPRGNDNITYLNYGASGLNIRNVNYSSTLFIDNAKNVGIFNTSPVEKLDVNGNIKASGIVYWGESNTRSERRDDAGLQGNAGAKSGFYYTDAPSPASSWPTGASSWWHLLDIRHSNTANNYALQISGSYFDQKLFFRKTNNSASTTWTKLITVPEELPYNATKTTFATGTSTEFYSDAYIKMKWGSGHDDVYFSAQAGSTGDWAIYSLYEYAEGDASADSFGQILNSTGITDWELLAYTSDGSSNYGTGGVVWLCKKDDNTKPIYKLLFHKHGNFKTVVVESLNAP